MKGALVVHLHLMNDLILHIDTSSIRKLIVKFNYLCCSGRERVDLMR